LWRHKKEHCLKSEQECPENSQGNPLNPAELHTNSYESLSVTHKEKIPFVWASLLGCGRSTFEEMYEKHHNANYQQDVDEAAGNVKSQESKQPKNDQNNCNYSQHFLNSFCL
jgi:hypothetical protein